MKPKTWNLNPAPHPRPLRAQLERTPLSPPLTPQQLTNLNRNTFSKLERPAVPSTTLDFRPWTLDAPSHIPKHSSTAPKRSSTLPNCSSTLPKCSRSPQLEPFPAKPIFTTISRQTTYKSDPKKSAPHLSTSPPEPRTPNPEPFCYTQQPAQANPPNQPEPLP